jgi:hypothetical protein
MADQNCRLLAEDVHQADHIANEMSLVVLFDIGGRVGLTIAPLIRGHDAIAGGGEDLDLVPP